MVPETDLAWRRHIRPEPPNPVSDWADRHRILPPIWRGLAEHVAKQLSSCRIFHTEMLHDLDALIALPEREAAAGTHVEREADDGHTRGGWPKLWRDERATSLAASAVELRRFQNSVAAVLDALQAERLSNRLTSGD